MKKQQPRDTACASCGKWLHILSLGATLYCSDHCRRDAGVPGHNETKRELRIGEIVQTWHRTSCGKVLGEHFYLVGKPYPMHPITQCYVFEKKEAIAPS